MSSTRFIISSILDLAELADSYPVEDDHSALLALETAILGNGEHSRPLITGPCQMAIDLLATAGGEIDGYRVLLIVSDDLTAPVIASQVFRVADREPLSEPTEDGGLYDTEKIIIEAVKEANRLLAWLERR